MSRFVEILSAQERELTVESFQAMLKEMVELLEAEEGRIEMSFPYFIEKKAPVSGVRSLMDYEVTFIGEIAKKRQSFAMKALVPVTSLCPCSKKISDYGAHNQRSHVTVTAKTTDFVWIEEIVDLIEKQASSELYGLLKRPDGNFGAGGPSENRNSSRTWCATWRRCSIWTSASPPTWSNRRISSRSTTTLLTPSSSATNALASLALVALD